MIEADHLCSKCEQEKREAARERAEAESDATEFQVRRLEAWKSAQSLINKHVWPDDGKPCPSDILHLAEFLAGEN